MNRQLGEKIKRRVGDMKKWQVGGKEVAIGWKRNDKRMEKKWRKDGIEKAKGWKRKGRGMEKKWQKDEKEMAKGWNRKGKRMEKKWQLREMLNIRKSKGQMFGGKGQVDE